MKAQRQLVQVHKHFDGETPHRIHRHSGKQGVARLGEECHQDAQQAVDNSQCNWRGKDQGQGNVLDRRIPDQRVSRPFEGIGHAQIDEFRHQQQCQRAKHPQLQVRPVTWPQIRPQIAHCYRERSLGGDARHLGRAGGNGSGSVIGHQVQSGRQRINDNIGAKRRRRTGQKRAGTMRATPTLPAACKPQNPPSPFRLPCQYAGSSCLPPR